jgi:valyl-tRNA synthetase
LESLLRLLHPFIPYITEELWQAVAPLAGKQGATIMQQPYPTLQAELVDQDALQEIQWAKQFILGVRRIRSEMDINPSKLLPVLLQNGSELDQKRLAKHQQVVRSLARIEAITWLNNEDNAPESATALVGEMRVLIPLAGLIDKEAELKRLTKEIEKIRKDYDKSLAKLQNPQFTDRAPAEVVQKEQQRVAEMQASISQLESQFTKIQAI